MFRTWWRRWRQRSARPSQRSPRTPARRGPRPGVRLEVLEDRLNPSFHFWTGDVNSLWSNAGNWLCSPDPEFFEMSCTNTPVGDPNAKIVFDLFPTNFASVNDLGVFTVLD